MHTLPIGVANTDIPLFSRTLAFKHFFLSSRRLFFHRGFYLKTQYKQQKKGGLLWLKKRQVGEAKTSAFSTQAACEG